MEEKKQGDLTKKLNAEKNYLINLQRHKKLTENLANNYQKRVKKFIIDVSISYSYNFFVDGRGKPKIRDKNTTETNR